MNYRKAIQISSLALSLSWTTNDVDAAIIVGETATTSSTISGLIWLDRKPAYMVDNSGLSSGADSSLVTPDQTHSSGNELEVWLSSGAGFGEVDTNPTVTIDLGAVYAVTALRVWNYNEAGFVSRGVQNTNFLVSTNNSTYSSLGSHTLAIAPGSNSYAGQFVDLAALNSGNPLTFRYFQFDIQSNYGDVNSFYGLSEVMFEGTLVPEPSSAILLIVSASGLLARRRTRTI